MTSTDSNVVELRQISDPIEFGDMLRLATEMELLKDSDVGELSLWAYLEAKNFQPSFFIRNRDRNFTIKTAWPSQGRIN